MNTVRYATKKTKLILSVCPACHETHIYRKWNTERDDTLDHIEYAKTKTESSRNDNDALNSHTYIANTMNSQVHPVEDERWRFFKYLPQWWRNRFRWEFVGCCNWRLGGRWVGVGIVRRWVDAVIEGGVCRDGILGNGIGLQAFISFHSQIYLSSSFEIPPRIPRYSDQSDSSQRLPCNRTRNFKVEIWSLDIPIETLTDYR